MSDTSLTKVLDKHELGQIRGLLEPLRWEREDTPKKRRSVAPMGEPQATQIIWRALLANSGFCAFAWPKALCRMQFVKYGPGDHYAEHIDSHTIQSPHRVDVSVSVMLESLALSSGLELLGRTHFLAPGHALAFHAFEPHAVPPIADNGGERIAAVAWVHSWIADPLERRILRELEGVRAELAAPDASPHYDFVALNLFRHWMR